MDTQMKIERCSTRLLQSYPFWGALLLGLEVRKSRKYQKMSTDGVTIWYNPDYVDNTSEALVSTSLAHEAAHKAFLHPLRRGTRDQEIWNVAADYVVNLYLRDSGLILAEDALVDEQFRDMDAEDVYDILFQNPDTQDQPNQGCGGLQDHPSVKAGQSGQPDQEQGEGHDEEVSGGEDYDPHSGEEWAPQGSECTNGEMPDEGDEDDSSSSSMGTGLDEATTMMDLAQARAFAKAQGNLPGSIERAVEEIVNPKIRWEQVLQQFMEQCSQDDFTWQAPDRRFLHMDVYLPSLESDGVDEFVVAVDTSSSITQSHLNQISAELMKITSVLKFKVLRVIYCDTKVQKTETFYKGDPIALHAKGGGGTSFQPPFEWLQQEGIEPRGMVYLTDLECSRFPEVPQFPVLWAAFPSRRQSKVPFGDVIAIE